MLCDHLPLQIRKMGLLGFLRLDVWMSILESKKKGNAGNFEGDGYHLGAVFVVGPGDQVTRMGSSMSRSKSRSRSRRTSSCRAISCTQGILYEHREKSWGDNVNASQVSCVILYLLYCISLILCFKQILGEPHSSISSWNHEDQRPTFLLGTITVKQY